MSTVLGVVDGRSWTDIHLFTSSQVYLSSIHCPLMNALQEEDAVSLDYNPVVEGVMGGLIPSTSSVNAS